MPTLPPPTLRPFSPTLRVAQPVRLARWFSSDKLIRRVNSKRWPTIKQIHAKYKFPLWDVTMAGGSDLASPRKRAGIRVCCPGQGVEIDARRPPKWTYSAKNVSALDIMSLWSADVDSFVSSHVARRFHRHTPEKPPVIVTKRLKPNGRGRNKTQIILFTTTSKPTHILVRSV